MKQVVTMRRDLNAQTN